MSQYLTFTLKKRKIFNFLKFIPKEIDLGYLCTTPARSMSSYGCFNYTEDDKLVTKEDMDNLEFMRLDHLSIVSDKKAYLDDIVSLWTKAETKAAVDSISERYDEAKDSLTDARYEYEEIFGWYKFVRKAYIKSVILKPFYEFYYNNC